MTRKVQKGWGVMDERGIIFDHIFSFQLKKIKAILQGSSSLKRLSVLKKQAKKPNEFFVE